MRRRILMWSCVFFLGFLPCSIFAASETSFILGPGDVLEISVWRDESLSKEVVIRPDGKFSFPLIGDMEASGKTVEELRESLLKRISEYVPDTPVIVLTKQITSTKVYVVGKVGKPGVFIMTEPMTVIQMLAMAGGLNPFAARNDILIIRMEGQNQKTISFRYDEVAAGKNLKANIFLQPGDTVVVP